ncbi:MAG: TRAP transporter substrate-binding protein, partial [Rhodospirillales bacterium]|nr:TRAP transporter substrate-binding protein [Rhodospirillales bacterium]
LGGIDPLFDLSSLPFLVPNLKEARRLWRIAKPEYEKIFDAHNMVLLWAMPNAPSGIHAKRAITTPEALDGLRIRTYDVNGTKTLKAAGASPLQIAWADLIPQLSTGGIDAVLTSADGGVHLSIWDYLSDFTALDYAMAIQVAHVNKDAYMSLSKDARTAIQEATAAAEDFNWQNVTASIQKSYDIMRSHGMTVTESAPAAVFERVNAAASEVRDQWLSKVGDRGKRILDQL